MMNRIIKRNITANRTTRNHGIFETQCVDKCVNEFSMIVNFAMLLPIHRIRTRVAGQVERQHVFRPAFGNLVPELTAAPADLDPALDLAARRLEVLGFESGRFEEPEPVYRQRICARRPVTET